MCFLGFEEGFETPVRNTIHIKRVDFAPLAKTTRQTTKSITNNNNKKNKKNDHNNTTV